MARRLGRQPLILLAYLAAGVAATWPRAAYLDGRLPASLDQTSYVWGFWWIAHQAVHLANPWFTSQMGAPVGVPLAFDTLMPLPGLAMAPITLAFGAGATYNLLAIVTPGLLCYVMYRAARLWLATEFGAIAAGALYGLSTMLTWRDWYHLNIALGAVFLPLTMEAAVRLRRRPGWRPAARLGAAIGAAFLVNQESAIMAAALAGLILLHWFAASRSGRHAPPAASAAPAPAASSAGAAGEPLALRAKAGLAAVAAAVGLALAAPQLVPMIQETLSGAVTVAAHRLAVDDAAFGTPLITLFSPSPRLGNFGLGALASTYRYRFPTEGVVTFGFMLTALAIAGAAVGWRRRHTRPLALLWAGCAVLSLGTSVVVGSHTYLPLAQDWHGVKVSDLMPYTWLVRAPLFSGFREADRFALVGLVPAALLAGSAAEWLRKRSKVVLVLALALAALEAGYAGDPARGTMPAALPAVDRAIKADHSNSIVVDIPFGLRGGVRPLGKPIPWLALVLATADGHPRAVSYTSWTPTATVAALRRRPFYRELLLAQSGHPVAPAAASAAGRDALSMGVGWALVWHHSATVDTYLSGAGFRFSYRADGVAVYRLHRGA